MDIKPNIYYFLYSENLLSAIVADPVSYGISSSPTHSKSMTITNGQRVYYDEFDGTKPVFVYAVTYHELGGEYGYDTYYGMAFGNGTWSWKTVINSGDHYKEAAADNQRMGIPYITYYDNYCVVGINAGASGDNTSLFTSNTATMTFIY